MYTVFRNILLLVTIGISPCALIGQNVDMLYNEGEALLFKGRSDLSILKFEQAYAGLLDKNSQQAALILNELGIAHWNQGNMVQALDYLEEALRIRKTYFYDNKQLMAASYNDIGLVYSGIDSKKALNNYEKAINYYLVDSLKHLEKIAQLWMNLGIVQLQEGDHDAAQRNFIDAKKAFIQIHGENHPSVAFALSSIAKVYKTRKIYNVAIDHYFEALQLYLKIYGAKHVEIAQVYDALGQCYLQQRAYNDALNYYQKALIAAVDDFDIADIKKNPPIKDKTPQVVLHTLFLKSQAFEELYYGHSLKIRDLKRSLSSLQSCDTLIDLLRRKKENSKDKIALGFLAEEVYDNAINIAYNTAEVAWNKQKYYNLSFYFSEKAKSAVLLEAIADSKAKSYAQLPEDVLEKEKSIKAELAMLEQKALKADTQKKPVIESELLQLNEQYGDFIKQLEVEYPAYYNLKYAISTADVTSLQNWIEEQTGVLSYFISSKNILYIFEITTTTFKVHRVLLDKSLDHEIKYLRNAILYNSQKTFIKHSHKLYQTLIPRRKLQENTIIIPHGGLGLIPFEALITEEPEDKDYSTFSYLLKESVLSYTYSATLLIQQNKKGTTELSTLVFAPIKFNHRGGNTTRNGVNDLPGTSIEAQKIKEILGNKVELDTLNEATESNLKSLDLKKYGIIHFATHGYVDEVNPELSQIYLAQETDDSDEDGNLYSGEIYNLETNANLVVLSACETGIGKVTKGEGIIGLSRALLYSGTQNLIASMWKVSDGSTAELMVDFYENLSKSLPYKKSLNSAKIGLIERKSYAAPYYWAPFLYIGN